MKAARIAFAALAFFVVTIAHATPPPPNGVVANYPNQAGFVTAYGGAVGGPSGPLFAYPRDVMNPAVFSNGQGLALLGGTLGVLTVAFTPAPPIAAGFGYLTVTVTSAAAYASAQPSGPLWITFFNMDGSVSGYAQVVMAIQSPNPTGSPIAVPVAQAADAPFVSTVPTATNPIPSGAGYIQVGAGTLIYGGGIGNFYGSTTFQPMGIGVQGTGNAGIELIPPNVHTNQK